VIQNIRLRQMKTTDLEPVYELVQNTIESPTPMFIRRRQSSFSKITTARKIS
jgi:hypothetical protein